MTTDRICVGAIAGSFGVKGEVRLKSFCADPTAIADYAPLFDETGSKEFTVEIIRAVNNGFAAHLSGVTTKEQADALRGTQLFANRAQLPDLTDDEYYHTDLIGLTVLDTGGTDLGQIKSVQTHGAGDLLEITPPNSSATILIPFTRANVPTIDLKSNRVIIDPPEGLF